MQTKRILFLVTEDWYFISHRLQFAQRMLELGFSISVGCRFSGQEERIRDCGIEAYPVPFTRESIGATDALRDIKAIQLLLRRSRPDLVHLIALRPILLARLARIGSGGLPFVNAITGMGSMFTGGIREFRLRLLRFCMSCIFRPVFRDRNAFNVFQNNDDLESFIKSGYTRRERAFLIRGAGVDPSSWVPREEPYAHVPVIVFVGRLLKDKGLGELLKASSQLNQQGLRHTLRIIGKIDPCNPKSFSRNELNAWKCSSWIEWLGKREDVLEQMSEANLVVLPSYREGLPKVLLEAGVAKRTVITTDVVGCREVVRHMQNGLLVPPRDVGGLASAIASLLEKRELRVRLAEAHRVRVITEFSLEKITNDFLSLYELILRADTKKRRPSSLSRIFGVAR